MESIVSLVAVVFLFTYAKSQSELKAKERERKMELLEQALANPSVDRATIQTLTQQLTGAKPGGDARSTTLAWLLAVGWLTLFSGLGVWVLGLATDEEQVSSVGLLVSVIGFGFITYPFALRELESRRPTA